jgi:hypothetical protein
MTFDVNLPLKSFPVDVPTVEAWVKANHPTDYAGASLDYDLSLHYTSDQSIAPFTTSTSAAVQGVAASVTVSGVKVQADNMGVAGNVSIPILPDMPLQSSVDAWNSAHPEVPVSIVSGDATQELSNSAISLTGGVDAVAAVVTNTPTGVPSVAEQIQEYWAAVTSSSPEATNATLNATKAAVAAQVSAARVFGNQQVDQFETENVMLGITADGKTEAILDLMGPVMTAMQSGSLTVAISRMKAIPTASYDSKYVTAVRILSYVNALESFMGLTLSTSLS